MQYSTAELREVRGQARGYVSRVTRAREVAGQGWPEVEPVEGGAQNTSG